MDAVGILTSEAVDALKLEGRVLDALRAELGDEEFKQATGKAMFVIEEALTAAGCDISNEAIEERVCELSEPAGTPLDPPSMCDV